MKFREKRTSSQVKQKARIQTGFAFQWILVIGVAAYNQSRNFIGCELSKEYYKKSIKRLKDLGIAAKEVIES